MIKVNVVIYSKEDKILNDFKNQSLKKMPI